MVIPLPHPLIRSYQEKYREAQHFCCLSVKCDEANDTHCNSPVFNSRGRYDGAGCVLFSMKIYGGLGLGLHCWLNFR